MYQYHPKSVYIFFTFLSIFVSPKQQSQNIKTRSMTFRAQKQMAHHYCNETLLGFTDLGNQPSLDLFSYKCAFRRHIPNLKPSPPPYSPSDLEEFILKTSLFPFTKTKWECFINS